MSLACSKRTGIFWPSRILDSGGKTNYSGGKVIIPLKLGWQVATRAGWQDRVANSGGKLPPGLGGKTGWQDRVASCHLDILTDRKPYLHVQF